MRDSFGSINRNRRRRTRRKSSAGNRRAKRDPKLIWLDYFYFPLALIFMEVAFHIVSFKSISPSIIVPILFAIPIGLITGIICNLFSKKVNYILASVFSVLYALFFCAQIVYHGVFKTYLAPFSMLGVADQAFDFLGIVFKTILANFIPVLLMFVPAIILWTVGRKWIWFTKKPLMTNGILFVGAILLNIICVLLLNVGGRGDYSPYDLYHNSASVDMRIKELGVLNTTKLDAKTAIFGSGKTGIHDDDFEPVTFDNNTVPATTQADVPDETEPVVPETGDVPPEETQAPVEIDRSPNILNIDFGAIAASTTDENVQVLSSYFANQPGTNKNEYTGMFKGYNVIFITAEGLYRSAIRQDLTPTLYRLVHEGFVFNNYYSSLWYGSTSGGEFANLTGLIPKDGGYVSMKETGIRGTNMYFTLGKQLGRLGYKTMGFHNNDYTYYGRDLSFPNMGYDWYGVNKGFEPELGSSGKPIWPQSDLKLIQDTFNMYAADQPFHTYYITVSGHVQYNFMGNAMAARNRDAVEHLPYSDNAKAYLACNLELEKAVAELIKDLEAAGIAEKTLIVLAPDHIPYDDKAICDELEGHELEEIIEWCKSNLIIWSASMKEPIIVDKPCSSIDILPTVSNLLGLAYDSRMMAGQDILSDSAPLVMFKSRSWITDKCQYIRPSDQYTYFVDQAEVTEDYIAAVKKMVRQKFDVSEMIIESNYYAYVDAYLNGN